MPSAYTHQLIAEDALCRLGGVPRTADYFFGAQGPDPMFFYRFIRTRGSNPGKLLHRAFVFRVFSAMLDFVRERPEAMSYALGYVSHYAADTVFHPFVFYLSDEGSAMDRNIRHTRVERDFDTYFLSARGIRMHDYRMPYGEEDINARAVTGVMNAAFGAYGMSADERHIRRAIAGWHRFLRNTYDRSGVRRRISDAIGGIGVKPFRLLGALFAKRDFDKSVLNLRREQWHNIFDPSFVRRDSADDLFARAVERTVQLACIFRSCAERGELPAELFSSNFSTGVSSVTKTTY